MTDWTPDDNLIDAARAGQLTVALLGSEDRSWVVAGLTARGLTAEDTAKLLDCSLRLIRQIRAHPMTALAVYAQNLAVEADRLRTADRRRRREHALEVEQQKMNADRFKQQRDDLIDQLARAASRAEERDA